MAQSEYRRRGTRYRSRKRAVSLLFEAEMRDVDAVELARERQEMGAVIAEMGEVSPFALEIVEGVWRHRDRIDTTVGDHLEGWVLERLPAVDRAILRVGAFELLFGDPATPPATVIDQAVLMTTELAADKSVGYVNAVLDRVSGLAEHIRAAEAAVSGLSAVDGEAATAAPAEDPVREGGAGPRDRAERASDDASDGSESTED